MILIEKFLQDPKTFRRAFQKNLHEWKNHIEYTVQRSEMHRKMSKLCSKVRQSRNFFQKKKWKK